MKKLIPCNLVMLLIALVGALSLLFMPLLSLNLGKMASGMLEDAASSEASSSENSEGSAEDLKNLTSVLDTEVTITTLKLGKIATAKNAGATFLTDFFLYKGGPVEALLLDSVSISVLSRVEGLDAERLENVDYAILSDVLLKLEKEDTNVSGIVDEYFDLIKTQLGDEDLFGEEEAEIKKTVTDLVTNVKNNVAMNNTFSIEALVCITLTGGKEGDPTTYSELAERLAKGNIVLGGNGDDAIGKIGGQIGEMLGTVAAVGSYLRYGFYGLLVFLLPWALFILLCLLHIFLKNKRCATWYLFTFGWLPCGIFWLAPMIAKLLFPKILKGMSVTVAAALGAIGSLAWISGLCLVVMWLVWLVWMRPLKRKARAERRLEEAAKRHRK